MIQLAERLLPLFAPVIHIEAGGAWIIARPARVDAGLVATIGTASLVADAVRRTGVARVLVPIDAGWREQRCEAFIVDDKIALAPLEPATVVIERGPLLRT